MWVPEGTEHGHGKSYAKAIKETNVHIFWISTGLMYSVRNTFANNGLRSPSLLQEQIFRSFCPTHRKGIVCMWICFLVITILLSISMLKEHGVHFNHTNCTTRNANGSSSDWREIMSNKKHFLKKTDRIENLNIYAKEQKTYVFFFAIFSYKPSKFYKFLTSVTINCEGFFFFLTILFYQYLKMELPPTILSKSCNK